ncbi:MAG: response regulator transcription factor [Ignavibacteria bacterium]|nr:response regulator transcription factor [Ignavibacteria bacterium]
MFRSEETINSHRKNIMSKLMYKNTEHTGIVQKISACARKPSCLNAASTYR